MSRKVALLVTAEVQTRIVVEVADDFDVENLNENEFEKIANDAKPYLLGNINHDFLDCVTDIELDKECPHMDYVQFLKDFINANGIEVTDNTDDDKPIKVYLFEKTFEMSINSVNDEVISIFVKENKVFVSFENYGFIFADEIDEDTAESIYLYIKTELNLSI
jgi:hypothetical protein